MQRKLATWSDADDERKFDRLIRLIAHPVWLAEAARVTLASSGAKSPGIDGMDKSKLEAVLGPVNTTQCINDQRKVDEECENTVQLVKAREHPTKAFESTE